MEACIETLPLEVVNMILMYLHPRQWCILAQVSNWGNLVSSSPDLWSKATKETFPDGLNHMAWKIRKETGKSTAKDSSSAVQDSYEFVSDWKKTYKELVIAKTTAYLKLVKKLPPPTTEQIVAFAEYVAGAHSWYKHLPLVGGGNFIFYLHPYAGCRRKGDEYIDYVRGDGTEFHYTWMPTAKYRQDFGYWEYTRISSKRDLTFWTPEYGLLDVPHDLVLAGSVKLTAAVHNNHNYTIWSRLEAFGFSPEFLTYGREKTAKEDMAYGFVPIVDDEESEDGEKEAAAAETQQEDGPRQPGISKELAMAFREFHQTKIRSKQLKTLMKGERDRQRELIKTSMTALVKRIYDNAEDDKKEVRVEQT